MSIRVYNTLSKTKEPLQPVQPGHIGMYVCGPTVYKPSHIGHMVGPVIFDVIKRYLQYSGFKVTWVVNITDVDDKLIAEANKRKLSMAEVASEMIADYHANLAAMGVDTIDHFPQATAYMDEIILFTQELIAKNFAYPVENGDVYFDVARDTAYGKLSGRNPEEMLGTGGDTADRKRSPLDFAIWKSAKPGEPSWDSPWGPGRPGWHIECSAMSRRLLGQTFDIHGGGLDLVFPHHENEIAQSECCHGRPQAKYWMHNGLVQAADEAGKVGGRSTRTVEPTAAAVASTTGPGVGDQKAQEAGKIGKSKGAQPFKELLAKFPPETLRFFLLLTHYRRPITFSETLINESAVALSAFYRLFQRYQRVTGKSYYDLPAAATRTAGQASSGTPLRAAGDVPNEAQGGELAATTLEVRTAFIEAMDDDFNTAGALGEVQKLVRAINRFIETSGLETATNGHPQARAELEHSLQTLRELTVVLGLFRKPVEVESKSEDSGLTAKLVELLISMRAELRKAKNFQLADKLRKDLADLGVILEDRPGGTEWTIKAPAAAEAVAAK